MPASLETRFTKFLECIVGAESIDALHTPSPNDPEMADYYLSDRKIVAEIKSLNADQMVKGSVVLDEHLSDKGYVIFGTLPSSRITDSSEEEAILKRKIQVKMTTRIKKICSKANKQIASQSEKLPHLATGLLILINENNTSLHPSMVAERVVDFAMSQPRSFHYCLLVFESHKISVNGSILSVFSFFNFSINSNIEFKSPANFLAFSSSKEILASLDMCFTVLRSIAM